MFNNLSVITDRLLVGGGPATAEDVQDLLNMGITHIIDCRSDLDDATLLDPAGKFNYLWNPTEDDGGVKPVAWFEKSINFGRPVLLDTGRLGLGTALKLYCHCQAGVNRGPSTAYAIARAAWGLLAEDTKILIRAHRPVDIFGLRYAPDADRALAALGYTNA